MNNLPLFVHSDIDDMTDLTPNALRVYMHLARRANKGGVAWPSYQTIGDHCFTSVSENPITRRSMARKAIDELITSGLIEKENRQNDGGHTSNAYLLAGAVSIGIAMPHNEEPMPIDTAMPNGTKDTLIEDTPLEDTPNEEDTQARDPLAVAWRQAYGDTIPSHLTEPLGKLVSKSGMAATIHGIKSGAKANSRNFSYIAECARNYVPPAPMASYVNGNGPGYAVDLPGVHVLTPLAQPNAPPPLLPPMPHDDPWAAALAELLPTLPGKTAEWLQGSQLAANGELAGVPFYRLTVMTGADKIGWLKQQAEPAIRKKVSSLFGKRIAIEIVAAEQEQVPA